MRSLEDIKRMDAQAIERGFTPRTHDPSTIQVAAEKIRNRIFCEAQDVAKPRIKLPQALPDFFIELLPGGRMPTKANPSDAGWDCYAAEDVKIQVGKYTKIKLGFKLQIPEGWEVQLRGRSGLAINQNIVSHFGTIDHLYRQELQAILTLLGDPSDSEEYSYYCLGKGDKACQMVLAPVYANRLIQVEEVDKTNRGGFGSTGR